MKKYFTKCKLKSVTFELLDCLFAQAICFSAKCVINFSETPKKSESLEKISFSYFDTFLSAK